MRFGWIAASSTITALIAIGQGCGGSSTASLDSTYTPPGTGGSNGSGANGSGGATAASGLPCDLQTLLQTRCDSCHGNLPSQGAPSSLVSYADLKAPSASDPTKTNAEVALARMQSTKQPMPPKPQAPATAAEIAILQGWITGGAQHGTCGNAGAGGTTAAGGGTGAGGSATTGIPCDVAAVLQAKCLSCHGSTLTGGAPMSLVTYADLAAPSLSDPTKSFAQVSATRMADAGNPMPPKTSNAATAAEIATFQAWVAGGAPMGTCGTGAGGGTTAPPPEACSAANKGTTLEDPTMNPGQPCMSCHSPTGDKPFAFGGTVYPKDHNLMNQCNGVSTSAAPYAGATVVVTDSNGKVFTVPVQANGNFYRYSKNSGFTPPYTAFVQLADGSTNKMGTTQTNGDCNSCHTDTGAMGAPGRIWPP